jgi:hypothetical protein
MMCSRRVDADRPIKRTPTSPALSRSCHLSAPPPPVTGSGPRRLGPGALGPHGSCRLLVISRRRSSNSSSSSSSPASVSRFLPLSLSAQQPNPRRSDANQPRGKLAGSPPADPRSRSWIPPPLFFRCILGAHLGDSFLMCFGGVGCCRQPGDCDFESRRAP